MEVRDGKLISGLRTKPSYQPRYGGRPDDVVAQAEMLCRTARKLTASELLAFHHKQGGPLRTTNAVTDAMVRRVGPSTGSAGTSCCPWPTTSPATSGPA